MDQEGGDTGSGGDVTGHGVQASPYAAAGVAALGTVTSWLR